MNYLSWTYWFNSRPEPIDALGMRVLYGIAVILIIIHIASVIGLLKQLKVPRSITEKLPVFVYINAFISLAFAFFNYEVIPYFRSRILYIIWAIIAGFWLWSIISSYKKRKSSNVSGLDRKAEIEKYLP